MKERRKCQKRSERLREYVHEKNEKERKVGREKGDYNRRERTEERIRGQGEICESQPMVP